MSLFTYEFPAPGEQIISDLPTVPIKSALSFRIDTREKEIALVEVALSRLDAAEASLHKKCGMDTWLNTRLIAQKEMGGDFSDRANRDGGIYNHSNISLKLPNRYASITKARAFNDLLMTDPLLAITAEGEEDEVKDAELIQRVVADAIHEADLKTHLREGVLGACVCGERVFKIGWEKKVEAYERMTRVLLDEFGEPLIDYNSNPIVPGDNLSEADATSGNRTLLRDPSVLITSKCRWTKEAQLVQSFSVVQDGLTVRPIPLLDFVCNTDAASIGEADCVGHKFQWTVSDLAALLESAGDSLEVQWALFNCGSRAQSSPRTTSDETRDMSAPTSGSMDALAKLDMVEIYLSVPLAVGRPAQEVAMLIDRNSRQPIYYDYLQNYSPTKKRPFAVERMYPVAERWYGTGFFELFADRHKFCDLMLNRINFSAGLSGTIRIQDREATEEGMAGEDIEFGTDKVYTLAKGKDKKIADVFKIIKVPDDSEAATNLMNMILQVTQLEAGMTSAGDHGLSGLPSAGLATGIRALERVANTILKDIFFDFITGIEEVLGLCVEFTVKNVSKMTVIRLVGEEAAARFERLREPGLLRYTTNLKLSATKDSDLLQTNNQALQILLSYEQLQPEHKIRWRPMFERLLRTLGQDDADAMLGDPANPPPAASPISNIDKVAPVEAPQDATPPEASDRNQRERYNYVDPNNPTIVKNASQDPTQAADVLAEQLNQETAKQEAETDPSKVTKTPL